MRWGILRRRPGPVLAAGRWRVALAATALAALGSGAVPAQDGVLTEWVENNPFNAQDRIALGYPPPVPVDTPLPFDGFRTYAGLHTRHQDLAATTPWVHPEGVGRSRFGRTVRAYRLGDEDRLTPWGLPESATLTNGGIHAREWQSPETVTGILERLATGPADAHLLDYLRDQVNMIVIPVMNVDGFLQTQRTPTLNWLQTDPGNPQFWPRDGRMRRKNMLGVDEDLLTLDDHLRGVDLNRNNPPYWDSSNGASSSDDVRSLVHHGAAPQSEPETRALDAAADLGPAPRLRLYTDVHSFSQVHFWSRTDNERLAVQTERVLDTFSDHHEAFPAGKRYVFSGRNALPRNQGIGTTDEYFTVNYEVPSWTLEVEPSGGQAFHAPLPGGGADYGGAGVNGHDGFILPESEIRRVREQLAETFTTVFYRQSGPPHLQSARLFDPATGALVWSADWDFDGPERRTLHRSQLQPVELGRDYTLWLGFSKPMRWLADGAPTVFPGQGSDTTTTRIRASVGGEDVELALDPAPQTLLTPGGAPDGYRFYKTDALSTTLRVADTPDNRERFAGGATLDLAVFTRDWSGLGLDADPATVADWAGGHWVAYENELGESADFGGTDASLGFTVTTEAQPPPLVLEPGIAGAWFDPARNGEGYIIEMLPDGRSVLYWFTYDDDGAQDWYTAVGVQDGNRLRFPEVLRVSGGVYGPGFDPQAVEREVVGAATFTWAGCDGGAMDWHLGNRRGRAQLNRLTRVAGLDCGTPRPLGPPIFQEAQYSGSWYDPTRSGEGFTLQIRDNREALVFWFGYGPEGARRWFMGEGALVDDTWIFPDVLTAAGPRFGAAYDPDALQLETWGDLELDLSCDGGEARLSPSAPDFDAFSFPLVQLTRQDGPACP